MTGLPFRQTTRRHLLGGLLGAASLPLGGPGARAGVRLHADAAVDHGAVLLTGTIAC